MSAPDSEEPLGLLLLDSIPSWGGGEAWTLRAALGLARRGHRVRVGCSPGSVLEQRAQAAGVACWTGALRGLGFWTSARSLRRCLRAERTQVVIANVGRDVRLGLLAGRGGVSRVIQRRGIARRLKRDPLNRYIYARGVRRVVANCAAIRDELLRGADFVDPGRVVVIPNGVSVPDSDPRRASRLGSAGARAGSLRAELGLDAQTPLAVCVARLAPMKGHSVLLEAWAALRRECPDAVLALLGTGESEPALRAAALPLGASVRFLGFRSDVEQLLPDADLFVLPSLRDEGCNNALLQSMAAGLPAVVSDLPALLETVARDETAVVAQRGSASDLARQLLVLLGDAQQRQRLGQAAYQRARSEFALDVELTRWEQLLRQVVRERAPL